MSMATVQNSVRGILAGIENKLSSVSISPATTIIEMLQSVALLKGYDAASSFDSVHSNVLLKLSAATGTELESWLADIVNRKCFEDLANNAATWSAVISNSTAWNAVMNSQTAWKIMLSSNAAMTAVVSNATVWAGVVNNPTAMNSIASSAAAITAISANNYALEALDSSSYILEAVGLGWNAGSFGTVRAGKILVTAVRFDDNNNYGWDPHSFTASTSSPAAPDSWKQISGARNRYLRQCAVFNNLSCISKIPLTAFSVRYYPL